MGNLTLALTLDGTAAWYGLGKGVGHMVMSPVENMGGDHIGSGTMVKGCDGKPLDADRAEQKYEGDKRCARCAKWEASDGFRDAHLSAVESAHAMESGIPAPAPAPVAVRENGVRVMTVPGDVTPDTPGDTDRVQRALDAARERAAKLDAADADAEELDDPEFFAPPVAADGEGDAPVVRPVTADDARDAVRTSKRGAAVARERERLEGVRERRAARKATRAPKGSGTAAPVDVVASLSDNTPSANAERDATRDRQNGTAAQRPGQARAWARITDGKCAVVVPTEGGAETTVTLSGRMLMESVTSVAQVAGLDAETMIIPVGKSAGALAPVPGTDADGVNGVCPVCHMAVKLTNSGAVGTHRPDGSTPDAPQLSGREIPAVDVRGEATRDAAKLRESEAYRDDVAVTLDPMAPVADQVAAVRAAVDGNAKARGVKAVRVPVVDAGATDAERERRRTGVKGARNLGRTDGVAMLPRGASGYAGVEFDNGGTFDLDGKEVPAVGAVSEIDPIKGGPFGTLRESQYNALSQSARRRYRAKIANARAIWEAGREKRKAERADKGMPRTDMRAARKAASVGSSRQGHTHSHHLSTAHTDTVVTPFGREPRAGRDVPADAH